MRKRLLRWPTEMRELLEDLLKKGYSVTDICEELMISPTALYSELKRGLSEEDFNKRRYVPYSAELASWNVAIKELDEKGIEYIRRYVNGEEWKR